MLNAAYHVMLLLPVYGNL